MTSLQQRAATAIRQLQDGDPAGPAAARGILLDAHRVGPAAWDQRLVVLLPELLAWAGMVEHALHYTDGPMPSVDWIETDLARYAADQT